MVIFYNKVNVINANLDIKQIKLPKLVYNA